MASETAVAKRPDEEIADLMERFARDTENYFGERDELEQTGLYRDVFRRVYDLRERLGKAAEELLEPYREDLRKMEIAEKTKQARFYLGQISTALGDFRNAETEERKRAVAIHLGEYFRSLREIAPKIVSSQKFRNVVENVVDILRRYELEHLANPEQVGSMAHYLQLVKMPPASVLERLKTLGPNTLHG